MPLLEILFIAFLLCGGCIEWNPLVMTKLLTSKLATIDFMKYFVYFICDPRVKRSMHMKTDVQMFSAHAQRMCLFSNKAKYIQIHAD